MRFRPSLCLVLLLLAGCGDDDAPEPACDAGTLAGRLGDAHAGDTVEVGACRIEGSFVVPEGVTIAGAGRDATILVGPEGSAALTLTPGAGEGTTVASDLSVESDGSAGVLAQGAGRVLIERVAVTASQGVAVAVFDASWLVLRELDLVGPVTPENADDIRPDSTAATHGLLVVASADATLENVSAHGFAKAGVLFYGSSGTWRDGEITDNLGIGVGQWGGTLEIQDVSVTHTLRGTSLQPSYGLVLADDADLDSTGLVVDDNDEYGILQASATARHLDLLARRNGEAAMWMQDATSLVVQGGSLEDNSFAGLVAVDSSGIELEDTSISGTLLATTIDGTGDREVGDGIQLVGSTEGVRLTSVTLTGNERAGLLADLGGGTTAGIELTGVTVDGTDRQLGVISQGGTAVAGWDDEVTRLGATVANDAAFLADPIELDIAGTASVPTADEEQLRGLIGPNQ